MRVSRVLAGKFRRYAHFSTIDYIKHPSIMIFNLLDLFKVAFGCLQSKIMILFWRPDVVFVKGGFVGLPVGLSVGRRPLVIHDSDTVPGLTNRILARRACKIATGMPLKNYDYDRSRSVYVGIPVAKSLKPPTASQQAKAKARFDFDPKRKLIVITGGGLGAKRLNDAVFSQREFLLKHAQITLIAGRDQREELGYCADGEGFKVYGFANDMDTLLSAADIVVARAGATTIAELAALAKPTVLVPNAMLPGSHQVKNAAVLVEAGAAKVLGDDELDNLTSVVREILDNPRVSKKLSTSIHKFAKPDAAKDLAKIILKATDY